MNRKHFLKTLGLGGILSILPINLFSYGKNNIKTIFQSRKNFLTYKNIKHFEINNEKYIRFFYEGNIDNQKFDLVTEAKSIVNQIDKIFNYSSYIKTRIHLKNGKNIIELKDYHYTFDTKTQIYTLKLELAS